VSEIRSNINKKRKQFVFRVTWPVEDESEDKDDLSIPPEIRKKNSLKKKEIKDSNKNNSIISPGKVAAIVVGGVVVGALTAGVGLIAGMVVLGIEAAASGAAAAASSSSGKGEKEKFLTLACDSYGDAERWTHAIENQIKELNDQLLGFRCIHPGEEGFSRRNAPPREIKIDLVEQWMRSAKWKLIDTIDGTRIFENVTDECAEKTNSKVNGSSKFDAVDLLRVNIPIKGSTSDVFTTLMNMPAACKTGIINNYRIVESMDNQTDIVHITLESQYIYPTWTGEFLVRYMFAL
jgi:F0F1-type ATP synthase assembly protein I